MVTIVWDRTLDTPQELDEDIKRWDEWFAVVGLTEAWEVVKGAFTDKQQRLNWAALIELNRIAGMEKHCGENVQ